MFWVCRSRPYSIQHMLHNTFPHPGHQWSLRCSTNCEKIISMRLLAWWFAASAAERENPVKHMYRDCQGNSGCTHYQGCKEIYQGHRLQHPAGDAAFEDGGIAVACRRQSLSKAVEKLESELDFVRLPSSCQNAVCHGSRHLFALEEKLKLHQMIRDFWQGGEMPLHMLGHEECV